MIDTKTLLLLALGQPQWTSSMNKPRHLLVGNRMHCDVWHCDWSVLCTATWMMLDQQGMKPCRWRQNSILLTTNGESKADVSLPREDNGCTLLHRTVINVSSWKGVEVWGWRCGGWVWRVGCRWRVEVWGVKMWGDGGVMCEGWKSIVK